jgi:molybdate transport system permease protein
MDVWHITWFTIACAAAATLLVLPAGVAVAWLLARRSFPGRVLVETLVSLPLVMPPVATGLILLMVFGRRGSVGRVLERWGIEIVFTWKAVVLAMAIMGLPLLVRTARGGFEQVNARYERVAATLGARPLRVFFTISLPLAWPSVLGGAILAFARALGEFGATIVVAGSIPGVTRTLAVGIYSHAETGQDAKAAALVAISVTIAFASLWLANVLTELAAPKRYREGGGTA